MNKIYLTEYSHGSGCGCKIAPQVLDQILQTETRHLDPHLLVGNQSRDDAAVYDLGNGQAVISTTDFFMPIVDDPLTFGRIAATNAISDIYAMGGRPILAIAILGWPLDKLPPEVAQQVVEGGRQACADAGISLAGGHSIDAPEPIFGLAVTGLVSVEQLKRNDQAQPGSRLYLTKPLGIGILSTAQKKKIIRPEDQKLAIQTMCQLNDFGAQIAHIQGVTAMTDVTGFGLLGHLLELCQGSNLQAELNFNAIPFLPHLEDYLEQGCSPGGAQRNFNSYGHHIGELSEQQRALLCDPQTSGGLLIAVLPEAEPKFLQQARQAGLALQAIGQLRPYQSGPYIKVESWI